MLAHDRGSLGGLGSAQREVERVDLPDCEPCEKTKPLALKAAEATDRAIRFINARTVDPNILTAKGIKVAPAIDNGSRVIKGEQTYGRLVRFFEE
ncbi:hypothetical protein [Streptomyces sp. G1]|uniref:hypothetical protein n=1 Tax=Streptomyces sp. G1 TaxID=361572 RepID=UPI00202EB583|nr:hypothetical protein [Streptomyces sp. G1]MCM1967237.1 hypothetical protein [Streptomyces sp. G1]